ncbi:MAG: hypothetical protein GY851_00860, partial [bacterium]|nr:hypothetical protein [bacterium]
MKLLCLCSALDLKAGYGCTPSWWQFFKGLYELGHEVVAIPYQGAAIESPWWRSYPNPCEFEGRAFAMAKRFSGSGAATSTVSGFASQAVRGAIDHWVRPRWERRIDEVMTAESDIAAVIVFSIPVNHFTGLPTRIRSRYDVPVLFFDGDVPASLPRFGGFASGFRIYDGADLSEYDAFMCNSEGGAEDLRSMGAQAVHPIHWGADPDLYAPVDVDEDRDVFFYGLGVEYREDWIESMVTAPSKALSDASFAVGGRGFDADLGAARQCGEVPFSRLRHACGRSRINLNIARDAHASVFASSSMRPFELAALGCC